MKIFQHHNVDELFNKLVKDYNDKRTKLDVFEQYTIAVPNKSVESWLTQALVEKVGICSGIRFISVYAFLNKVHDSLQSTQSNETEISNKRLLSKADIHASLYQILKPIKDSLEKECQIKDDDQLKIIKKWFVKQNKEESLATLCQELSNTFELYQIYRPEYLDDWEKPDNAKKENDDISQSWQGELWRQIIGKNKDKIVHRKALTENFEDVSKEQIEKLGYKQLIIFGLNEIDEQSVLQLKHVAEAIDVTFLWQVASENLFGNEEQKSKNKDLIKQQKAYFDDDGHNLLSSWGTNNRVQRLIFNDAKLEEVKSVNENTECNKPQLHKIQHAIINNKPLSPILDDKSKLDESLKMVSHFSPYREIEGVYDHILTLFDNDKDKDNDNAINPNDILVLCPEINLYAPAIRSVFDNTRIMKEISTKDKDQKVIKSENKQTEQKVPFQLCGINTSSNDVPKLMLQLISMPQTRYPISDIIDLLGHDFIKMKFEISDEETEQLHTWLKASNAKWGLDKATLKQLNLPEYDRYTIQCAIDRLVMGLAIPKQSIDLDMTGNEPDLIYGVQGVSALHSGLISKLISFINNLVNWRDNCLNSSTENSAAENSTAEKTAAQWVEIIKYFTSNLINVPNKKASSLNAWYHLIAQLEQNLSTSKSNEKYSYAFIQSCLQQQVEDINTNTGSYAHGKVNIGSFGTLKGISAKHIIILGLNEADFPRKLKVDSIDLTIDNPKYFDRNRTNQDKDAFLMALLNSKESLYCSYVGKSMTSTAERIPSLVFQELLEQLSEDEIKQKQIVTQHPMKAYSTKYLESDELKTYQSFGKVQNNEGNEGGKNDELPKWEVPEQLSLKNLKDFLEDPTKAFFKERFGITLPDIDNDNDNNEPMNANGLTRWKFINDIVEEGINKENADLVSYIKELKQDYKASGLMEHDTFAAKTLGEYEKTAKAVLTNALKITENKNQVSHPFSQPITIEGDKTVTLTGELNLYQTETENSIVHCGYDEKGVKDKYIMRAIVDNTIAVDLNESPNSYIACKDGLYKLKSEAEIAQESLDLSKSKLKKLEEAAVKIDIELEKAAVKMDKATKQAKDKAVQIAEKAKKKAEEAALKNNIAKKQAENARDKAEIAYTKALSNTPSERLKSWLNLYVKLMNNPIPINLDLAKDFKFDSSSKSSITDQLKKHISNKKEDSYSQSLNSKTLKLLLNHESVFDVSKEDIEAFQYSSLKQSWEDISKKENNHE